MQWRACRYFLVLSEVRVEVLRDDEVPRDDEELRVVELREGDTVVREEEPDELRVVEDASRFFSFLVLFTLSFRFGEESLLELFTLPRREVLLVRTSCFGVEEEDARLTRLLLLVLRRVVVYTSFLFSGRLLELGRMFTEPKSERKLL